MVYNKIIAKFIDKKGYTVTVDSSDTTERVVRVDHPVTLWSNSEAYMYWPADRKQSEGIMILLLAMMENINKMMENLNKQIVELQFLKNHAEATFQRVSGGE
jgi:hypothetical protein